MQTRFQVLAMALLTAAAASPLSAAKPDTIGPTTHPAAKSPPEVTFTTPQPAGPTYVPNPSEIARMVHQLDDDDYPIRVAATKALAEMPGAALQAVEKALQEGPPSPEVVARTDSILQALRLRASVLHMRFEFQATPADAILTEMSQHYGFVIIQAQPLNSPITVQNPNLLDAEASIKMLNNLLFPLGYMTCTNLTPDGHTVLRVATISEIKKAQIPVYLGAQAKDIPLTDQLITQIIPLHNIPANQLRIDFGGMGSLGDTVSNAASNTLVVTDTSAKIHNLVQIIEKLENAGQKARDAGKNRGLEPAQAPDKFPAPPAPTMKFQFEATTIDEILTEMSRRYGFIIIQAQPITAKISVQNPTPLDAKGGISLLNNLLYPLGYISVTSLTPDGYTVLRVSPWSGNRKMIPE